MRRQYGIKYDEYLIERVDEAARTLGVNRTALIEACIESGLERMERGLPLVRIADDRLIGPDRVRAFREATQRRRRK